MLYRLELMLAAGECLTLAKPVLAEEIVTPPHFQRLDRPLK